MPPQCSYSGTPIPLLSRQILLKRGERFMEPDVIRCQQPGGVLVVKDYARYERTLWAPLAAWLVQRERHFLTLAAAQGISPAPLPSHSPLLLTMEWVEGRMPAAGDEQLLAQATDHLNRLFLQGVVHNDIHASNIMVVGRTVQILDWASALEKRWWTPWGLIRQLHARDMAHVVKMKAKLAGRPLGVQEQREQTPPWWVRLPLSLWRRLYRGS